MTEFVPKIEHERFEELCALATAQVLTPVESDLLARHLETCALCRQAFEEYRSIASREIPSLADHLAARTELESFDESSALTRLMQATGEPTARQSPPVAMTRRRPAWQAGVLRGLLAASLFAAVGAAGYRAGRHAADGPLHSAMAGSRSVLESMAARRETLERTIREDNLKIASLEQRALADRDEMTRIRRESERQLEALKEAWRAAQSSSDVQLAGVTAERDAAARRMNDVQGRYESAQGELNALRGQRQQDLVRLASLETTVDDLTAELKHQDRRARTDEQFLASDKDIRDLIGARNLYIADIMDVNPAGESRKPFGRVFYTQTKSLIFYAYDLDKQPGVKRTSTFQVWGRTSGNSRKPINLGILYMDSETNRRWTMHVENPEQLARLDSIFVTIEPHEQADKPTGKTLLYTSLRRVPNHP